MDTTESASVCPRPSLEGFGAELGVRAALGRRMCLARADALALCLFTPHLPSFAVSLLIVSMWPLETETSEQTRAGRRREAAWRRWPSLVQEPVCSGLWPTLRTLNFYSPSGGLGWGRGSSTLTGTELPQSCTDPGAPGQVSHGNSGTGACVERLSGTVRECVRSLADPINTG